MRFIKLSETEVDYIVYFLSKYWYVKEIDNIIHLLIGRFPPLVDDEVGEGSDKRGVQRISKK